MGVWHMQEPCERGPEVDLPFSLMLMGPSQNIDHKFQLAAICFAKNFSKLDNQQTVTLVYLTLFEIFWLIHLNWWKLSTRKGFAKCGSIRLRHCSWFLSASYL